MRVSRVRVSTEKPFDWFAKNFGVGGFENYTYEQVRDILQAMNLILDNCGNVELDFIGRFLIKLSESPTVADKFYKSLIENIGG